MKKSNIVSFLIMLIILASIVTLAPADQSISERENRRVVPFPEMTLQTLLNGDFGRQFEVWLGDQVGFRSSFINASMSVTKVMGIAPPAMKSVIMSYDISMETIGISPDDSASSEMHFDDNIQSNIVSSSDIGIAEESIGINDMSQITQKLYINPIGTGQLTESLLVFDDRIVELFYSNQSAIELYADVLNQYRDSLPINVRMFSIIVPTQIEFLPEIYQALCDSQIDAIEKSYALLSEGITSVNVSKHFSQHINEYLYFRTDHHWTALGAYYAYAAFAEVANLSCVPISEYTTSSYSDFLGYLYYKAPIESIKENPDTIDTFCYTGSLETTVPLLLSFFENEPVSYGVFLGGDHALLLVETSIENGKSAIIIKDSYANCFIPWLAPHYERLIVLDPRMYEGSVTMLINEYDEVDLIFLNYALILSYTTFIESMLKIL